MSATAAIILEITLDNASDEVALVSWWVEARKLLSDRFYLDRGQLHVLDRGRYLAVLEFPLPGAWKAVQSERHWQELERQRPAGRVETRNTRLWHINGGRRDLTTAELVRWLDERAAGARDFVLVDTLPADSYRSAHIPGAIGMPLKEITAQRAAQALGADRDRAVVMYCSGYG